MPLDLTGIDNANEFYTQHYLSAILETDLKPVFESWVQLETPPYEALKRLAPTLAAIEREKDKSEQEILRDQFFRDLLAALGYPQDPDTYEFDDGSTLPLRTYINRPDGRPELWALDSPASDGDDPLADMEDRISKQIFAVDEPPRWVLLCGGIQLLLLDRTKWPQKRLLRFQFDQILTRREPSTLRATAALLHRDSVCPENQVPLLDKLDENSHRHAFAVSQDLKYAAREAVELIANEVVWYLGNVLKEGKYDKGLAEQLTRESLRYLYRLLFLFYMEARDEELGYAPMRSEEYRTAYSLESLREIAEREIHSEEERNGYFFDDSLKILFGLVHDGHLSVLPEQQAGDHNFQMQPLRCDLFDPQHTPTLRRVRLRSFVLREVIDLLSYSRPGQHNTRGRISYAQLGINQLGAVYEGLLSYTGFFVETDGGLYEVKPANEDYDPLHQAYFVPLSALEQYKEEEKVYDERGKLVHHPKGKFLYRLAGRNRQKSASYYTPEVLTQCVVKYALKELLAGKSADDVLRLTICEPAMGSGAFLNEAVNQLADAYLERKQKETARNIPFDEYSLEKQKVKAYLADNRVFGVDRNPIAIELAEISLWLNTIYRRHTIPWFGAQLVCGNSLIGARRQVFTRKEVESDNRLWLDSVPGRLPMAAVHKPGQIWHWLVPDSSMSEYTDRAVKGIWPVQIKAIADWRKKFTKKFDAAEIAALERLSAAGERLWQQQASGLAEVRRQTAHLFPIFGQEKNPAFTEWGHKLTTHERDQIFIERIDPKSGPASAYQRLKLAMDYWCALWFWPVLDASELPTRAEYLAELSAILEGPSDDVKPILGAEQLKFAGVGQPQQAQLTIAASLGTVELATLREKYPRLKKVEVIAAQHHFLHWELEYADLFREHGGFDLILGNPPWIKFEWNAGNVLGDFEPLHVLRGASAPELKPLIAPACDKYPGFRDAFLTEYVELEGGQNFLNAKQNYPLLVGTQSNTYKCFLTQAWLIAADGGTQGFLHPEGVFDDPKGGPLRQQGYKRLRFHFQFQNELKLFPEIGNQAKYSVNAYASVGAVSFQQISNLFHPSTVDASFAHDGRGICGGIKNDNGAWNLDGHVNRIIKVSEKSLALFAKLYDDPGKLALEARLPSIHSRDLLSVLHKFSEYPKRLGDLAGEYDSTVMWDETNRVKDGTIRRETRFPCSLKEWILSGPHIYVARPFFQTPEATCHTHRAYDLLDLTTLPVDYLPRTNYVRACSAEEYARRTPRVTWGSKKPVTDFYRFVARRQLAQAGERTMIPAIAPPGAGHIHPVISLTFADNAQLITFLSLCATIPYDFFVKTTAKSDLYESVLRLLPMADATSSLLSRVLLLTCLTTHYADLWKECWNSAFTTQRWAKSDTRLSNSRFSSLTSQWQRLTPLRTDLERRQALVEIDVLAARALGLTLDQLCAMYRIQFPVFRQNENNTFYDRCGRTVYRNGEQAYGLPSPYWKEVEKMTSGTATKIIQDDTLPGGPTERVIEYHAPFDKFDREADYAEAWRFFDEAGV